MARSCLLTALALARADGRYTKLLRQIARVDLLVLDDWGPETLTADQRRDLLEIVEDRHDARSIIVTTQVPVDIAFWEKLHPAYAEAARRMPRGVVSEGLGVVREAETLSPLALRTCVA